jgi:HK97 gp10 family phage protein
MRSRVNTANLSKFKQQMSKLTEETRTRFTEAAVRELAGRLLARAVKRTPVYEGIPDDVNAHPGGTLRRGWTVGEVTRSGNTYTVEVYNNVEYAEYVEFGHRGVYVPALGVTMHTDKRFTEGRFMLTISEAELQADAPTILMNKLDAFMRKHFK